MSEKLMETTSQVVAGYLARNEIDPEHVPGLIHKVAEALSSVAVAHFDAMPDFEAEMPDATELTPAVPIEESVTPDYIVCLEDGQKLKMLKRYLQRVYKLSPEQYRERWGLPKDYPMVAPNYSRARSRLARSNGFVKAGEDRKGANLVAMAS